MKLKQIKSNAELKLALTRLDEIWETEDAEELVELDFIATLISDYEDEILIEERKNQQEITVSINDL